MHLQRNIALLTAYLCSWAFIMASAGREGEEEEISIRFSVYGPQLFQGLTFFEENGVLRDLRFYSSSWSPRYDYRGPPEISFYRRTNTISEDGESEGLKRVSSFRVPEGVDELFIVFFSMNRSSDSYRVFGFDASLQSHPPGTVRLFNATPRTYFGYIGSQRVTVSPGPMPEPIPARGVTSARLITVHNNRPTVAFERTLMLDRGERSFLFLFPSHSPRSLRVQARQLGDTVNREEDLNGENP